MSIEFEGSVFGNYLKVKADDVEEAKKALLEEMILSIRDISKDERFWIVKSAEDFGTGPYVTHPQDFKDDEITVAWKVHFPQMDQELDYKGRMVKEYWDLKVKYRKLHDMCIKYQAGTLDFEPTCSLELLKAQKAAMGKYLECLEIRAQVEKLDLFSLKAKV